MSEWQPIETAPKDGSPIVGWQNGLIVCWWADDDSGWDDGDYRPGGRPKPTHWMRPDPPK